MITTATYDMWVNRNTPGVIELDFEGYDLSAASMSLQVRLRKGAPDPALISLDRQNAGTEGMSVVVTTVDEVPVSTVTIQIDEATIDGLLPAATNGLKAGSDVVLAYDLIIDGGGVGRVRWIEGSFTIREGVGV